MSYFWISRMWISDIKIIFFDIRKSCVLKKNSYFSTWSSWVVCFFLVPGNGENAGLCTIYPRLSDVDIGRVASRACVHIIKSQLRPWFCIFHPYGSTNIPEHAKTFIKNLKVYVQLSPMWTSFSKLHVNLSFHVRTCCSLR